MVYANLDWSKAKTKLVNALHVAFATRYIRRTKIALIGHQAPGFVDFHPDPVAMSRQLGAIFQQVGLAEYVATALDTVTPGMEIYEL